MESRHPGDKIQIDIRYVSVEYIHLPGYGYWYYQITGTDEYNRKVFTSEKELWQQVQSMNNKTTKTALVSRIWIKLYQNNSQSVTYVLAVKSQIHTHSANTVDIFFYMR